MKNTIKAVIALGIVSLISCNSKLAPIQKNAVKPIVVTQALPHDTDDPAIWINPQDATKSIIIGTDKDTDGGL